MSLREIVVPEMPSFNDRVKLVKWHVGVGDAVQAGDALADVENEKAAIEIEAATDGTLTEILVPEGGATTIGAIVGRLQAAPGETAR